MGRWQFHAGVNGLIRLEIHTEKSLGHERSNSRFVGSPIFHTLLNQGTVMGMGYGLKQGMVTQSVQDHIRDVNCSYVR